MYFSLKNNKNEYLLHTDYGYSFIEGDRTHKYYVEGFWFGFCKSLHLIWNNPEDKLKICRKIEW